VGCATIGLQGNTFYLSLWGFSWTFWRKPSAFIGISQGFNTAGQQMLKNNVFTSLGSNGLARVLGNVEGAVGDFGGGVGASTYVGPNGPGKIYPNFYGTMGEGWQFSAGYVTTWHWTAPAP
jgi:hypothetical protein